MRRLKTLAATTDGFQIAQADLEQRGPGDFFGSRQHGLPQLRLASLTGDMEVLSQAQRAARELLERDPALSRPESRVVLLDRGGVICTGRGTDVVTEELIRRMYGVDNRIVVLNRGDGEAERVCVADC